MEVTQIVSGWWLFSQKWYFLAVCFAASCSWCVAAVTAFWWRSVLSSLQLTGDLQRFLQETASCFQKSILCLLFLKETFSGCDTVEPGLLLLHDIVHLCNEWSVLVTLPMLMGFYMQNANLTAYFSLPLWIWTDKHTLATHFWFLYFVAQYTFPNFPQMHGPVCMQCLILSRFSAKAKTFSQGDHYIWSRPMKSSMWFSAFECSTSATMAVLKLGARTPDLGQEIQGNQQKYLSKKCLYIKCLCMAVYNDLLQRSHAEKLEKHCCCWQPHAKWHKSLSVCLTGSA